MSGEEVWIRRITNVQNPGVEAARFVAEELEQNRRDSAEMVVDGAVIGFADIEQMYMAAKS